MSRSVEVIKVITPELNLNNSRRYVSLQGSTVTTSQTFQCPNPNTSSIQISCTPPSQNIAISRHILKTMIFEITVAGTNTSGSPTLLQNGFHGPRAWPMASVTTSETLTVNDSTLSMNPVNLMWPAMLRYSDSLELRNAQYSTAISTLDKSQNYSDLIGSQMNPLLDYAGSSPNELGRASMGYAIVSNGPTGAVIRIQSTEPIIVSPFVSGSESYTTPALIGVSSMTYTSTLGNINRVMSTILNQGVTGIALTSLSTQVLSAQLEFLYLTPEPSQPIPRTLVSSYYTVTDYPTQANQTAAPGQIITIPSSSIQLNGIPKRIIIFASQSTVALAADTMGQLTDTYLSFAESNPITITFNNNQFMAGYTQRQLYNVAISNGCNLSWPQWCGQNVSGQTINGFVGSVLAIDFAKDLGLGPLQAPGVLGNFQFQINTQWLNCNQTQNYVNPTLHCLVINEGTFVCDNGHCQAEVNILSEQDVANAQFMPNVIYTQPKNVYGGLFSGFSNILSKIPQFLKDTKLVSNVLSAIPNQYAQLAGVGANAFGYGNPPKRRKPSKKGAALVGGRRPLAARIRGAGLIQQESDSESSSSEYSE